MGAAVVQGAAHIFDTNSIICFDFFLFNASSPAPLELKQPRIHQPDDCGDIDLNLTYDVATPEVVAKKTTKVPSKKMRLGPSE